MAKNLGYNINTGEKITLLKDRMVHVGNGFYEKYCDITQEDLQRRAKFLGSIDKEMFYFNIGREEE